MGTKIIARGKGGEVTEANAIMAKYAGYVHKDILTSPPSEYLWAINVVNKNKK